MNMTPEELMEELVRSVDDQNSPDVSNKEGA